MSFVPLEHKAAGHDGAMQSLDGSLFIKPTNAQELQFYTSTQAEAQNIDDQIELGSKLFHWMPVFYGTMSPGVSKELHEKNPEASKGYQDLRVSQPDSGQQYLVLENVVYGFKKPSVIDLKLGNILYDENASIDKVERMKKVSNTTTSGSLHYRICGMKIVDSGKSLTNIKGSDLRETARKDDGYLLFDKNFGKGLTSDTVKDALLLFFRGNDLSPQRQAIVLQNTIRRLQLLYNCLLEYEIRMISASLLLVYENDEGRWEELGNQDILVNEMEIDEDSSEEDAPRALSLLKLIDFAHTKYTPGKGNDESILTGIQNLLELIQTV
ncbi:hypothetical protein KL935_002563 [Ogataea polymorpha]|uniref:Kinase n=1 Tax=Ogataea polymorpha TaxID=460523 RepID=A0A9P8NT39_9ASCO|nr:hypothetical protein KL908_002926 [Ogataea polymorpha]KAG7900630.1 hypothetical protein KL935_002563 [Ogataea polymorpha]KAG7907823.1 hypothetical protein KL906_003240 [Ogataea polymorpha]KAG7916407.1 hypothetical protein KL927_003046 [Ogataea polymorpha]KAH3658677.1 hypothetical protein OGATHE_006401 [Ogataea polymorpha]